ncbi:hypothetical protein [Paenibacillus sp. M2]|uniref:hypothetical protein n=1 Tax=Paenibacillus sp. M2 TaxID=3341793 RepID=UPI003989DE87
MSLTYENLIIEPYELVHLQELTIRKKMNEHTRLVFKGMVSEEWKDRYVDVTDKNTPIEVWQKDEEGNKSPLFKGIPLSVEVQVVRGVYTLQIEAISHTYLMDVKKRTRTFQNIQMTLPELLKELDQDYPGLDVIDEGTGGAKIGKVAVQYQETDWAFLRRLASRFHTSLMPAAQFDSPKFYFGVYEHGNSIELDNTRYTVHKNMTPFMYFTENETVNVNESDFIVYEVETDQVMELGHHISFRGRSLYLTEAYTELAGGILKHKYVLSLHKGLRQKTYYNPLIAGSSLMGRVIGVHGGQVQVHLDCDDKQGTEDALWLLYQSPYIAEGETGWYVMPEIGDPIAVYFPTMYEEDAYATGAPRLDNKSTSTNKLNNPDHKIFRTPHGKEIRLTPDAVIISGKEGEVYIRLSGNEGIHIAGSQQVSMSAGGSISLKAGKKITLSAGSELLLEGGGGKIRLDGQAQMSGTEVKSN